MLSKSARKLLKWLKKHDEWMSITEIKQKYEKFDDRDFKAILEKKYVAKQLDIDGDQWCQYRISDSGKAYLEGIQSKRLPELREWVNVVIALVTFLSGALLSDPMKNFFRWLWEMLT